MSSWPWMITLFTVTAVFYLDRWENRYLKTIFDWIPAILLAYLIPAGITYWFNVDFSQDAIHDISRDYFIGLAIISVMSSLSLSQLKSVGIKPIILFVSGSGFIALFPVLFIWVFSENEWVSKTLLTAEYWKGIPAVVGSWIGGSTSQLVLKELVGCSEEIFLTVLVMDNILVNVWTIIMFQAIKRSQSLNSFLKITDNTLPSDIRDENKKSFSWTITFIILVGLVYCVVLFIESFIVRVVFLSIIGLLLGNGINRWNYHFSLRMGSILILVVMAVLGLKLRFEAFTLDLNFFGLLVVWLLGHYLFMMMVAKLMNLNMAWVPIASMANVGGIATAPAVTAAFEKQWMPHAIVLAILSMATGTFWGMLTIFLISALI